MATTLAEQAVVSMEVLQAERDSQAKELVEGMRALGFSFAIKPDGKNLSIKPGGLSDIQKKHLKNLKREVICLLKWESDEATWGSCKGEHGGKAAYESLERWYLKTTDSGTLIGQQWAKAWSERDKDPTMVADVFGLYLRALRDSALAVDEGRKLLPDWQHGAAEFKRCVVGLHWGDPVPTPEAWELAPDDMVESLELHRQRDALCSGLADETGKGDAYEPEEDR